MSEIIRHESNSRLSRVVVHDRTVYLAGVTSVVRGGDIAEQTKSVLEIIDSRLASVGSSKDKILVAQIWLKDIGRDFDGLNAAWESWIPVGGAPARATCEAKLASDDLLVEILVTASV